MESLSATRTRLVLRPRMLAAPLAALLLLGACSGGDEPERDRDETTTTSEVDPAEVTTTMPDTNVAPGETIPPASVPTEVALSETCTEAVSTLREIMARYESGLAVSAEDAALLGPAISTLTSPGEDGGEPPCGEAEFQRFYNEEFAGWLTPPPTEADERETGPTTIPDSPEEG